jgi:hypothetical protein
MHKCKNLDLLLKKAVVLQSLYGIILLLDVRDKNRKITGS